MKKYIVLLLFVLAGVQVMAQVDRTKPPKPGPAPKIQLGDYQTFELKNGLKVFVVENNKIPQVTFSMVLDIDPILEKDKVGYLSMVGGIMRRGTTTRTKDQIDREIDYIGASLGATAGSISGSSLKKHTNTLLTLMRDVLLNPAFPEEELEKIKTNTLSGLAFSKNDPNSIASNVQSKIRYGADHPYGELTTEETVENVTIDDLKQYYQTYFRPNVAYMAVVGDISKKEAKKLVTKYFGDWERGDVPTHKYETPQGPDKVTVALVDRPNSVQSIVDVHYPVSYRQNSPDYFAAEIMNSILGTGSAGRLFKNLRETRAFTYGAYSSLNDDKLIGSFNAGAAVRNDVTDSAIVEIFNEMRLIRAEPISDKELQDTKNFLIGQFARSLESPATIASFAINAQLNELPDDFYATYLQRVQAVTKDDVMKAAQKYINPDAAYIQVVGSGSDVAEKLKAFGPVQYYTTEGEPFTPSDKRSMPAGMTAEKVIESHLKAIGGDAVANMQNLKMVYSGSVQGTPLELTQIETADGNGKQAITVNGMMTVSEMVGNADEVTMKVQGAVQPLPAEIQELQRYGIITIKENKLSELGLTPTLEGTDRIAGQDVYKVKYTSASGIEFLEYYHMDNFMRVAETFTQATPQGEVAVTTEFSDFKAFDGIMVPQVVKRPLGGGVFIDFTLTSAEVNTDLPAGTFDSLK